MLDLGLKSVITSTNSAPKYVLINDLLLAVKMDAAGTGILSTATSVEPAPETPEKRLLPGLIPSDLSHDAFHPHQVLTHHREELHLVGD